LLVAADHSDHGRLPALDGIRGFAVLWVMLHHFLAGAAHHNPILNGIFAFARYGYWGVDIFFVLSGFLITGILLDTRGADNYFRSFYARRALRIFPLYYFALYLVFVLVPLFHPLSAQQSAMAKQQIWMWAYVGNIAMVVKNAPIFDAGGIKLLHFWSLAIEEQFYLVWPAVVLMFSRRGLVVICSALIVLATVSRITLDQIGIEQPMASFFTLSRLDGLALGAIAAVLARGAGGLERWIRPAKWLGVSAVIALALALLAMQMQWLEPLPGYCVPPLRLGVFVSVLVLAVGSAGPARQALSSTWLRFLGKYSYALYVFHYMLIPVFDRLMPRERMTATFHSFVIGAAVRLAICIAVSIVAALLSWHLLEKHFLGMKRWFAPHLPITQPSLRPALIAAR